MSPRGALIAGLLLAGGCVAPGDYIDKWFGSGPAQKPAELTTFKPVATARIVWQGTVGAAEKYVFTPAVDSDSVYAAAESGQIVRFDAATGKVLARIDSKSRLSGGVGTDGRVILAGTAKGRGAGIGRHGQAVVESAAVERNTQCAADRSGRGGRAQRRWPHLRARCGDWCPQMAVPARVCRHCPCAPTSALY